MCENYTELCCREFISSKSRQGGQGFIYTQWFKTSDKKFIGLVTNWPKAIIISETKSEIFHASLG